MRDDEELSVAQARCESIRKAMYRWDGSQPAPRFSHWMKGDVYEIVVSQVTIPVVVNVMLNGEWIGSGIEPIRTCAMIAEGRYDKEFGFSPTQRGLPATLLEWNNLR